MNKPKTDHGKTALFKEGGSTMATKNNGITKAKMGAVRTAAPSKDGVASRGKTKGTMISMKGGKPLGMKTGGTDQEDEHGQKASPANLRRPYGY